MNNPYLTTLRSLPKIENLTFTHNAVSLFSGGGGLDLGLALAGFKTEFSSDKEPQHCETIRENFPECKSHPIDVNELTVKKIQETTGHKKYDLLYGGPPCQAFSILGRRSSFEDPRGKLGYGYARLI